jgi:protein involved in polysaccharide export with SLBB domain
LSIAIGAGAGAGFNTNEDLTSAVAQIQSFIDRLQQQGKSPEEAQSEVAQNIATQAQNDPTVKEKLIEWEAIGRHCHSNRCG